MRDQSLDFKSGRSGNDSRWGFRAVCMVVVECILYVVIASVAISDLAKLLLVYYKLRADIPGKNTQTRN